MQGSDAGSTARYREFMSFALKLVVVLGLIGAGAFGAWMFTRNSGPDPAPEEEVDTAGWCASGTINGLSSVCWRNHELCASKRSDCVETSDYACFNYTEVTSQRTNNVCMRTYGECAAMRDRVLADREASKVAACVVYRAASRRERGTHRPTEATGEIVH